MRLSSWKRPVIIQPSLDLSRRRFPCSWPAGTSISELQTSGRMLVQPGVRPSVPQLSAVQGSEALVPRSHWTFCDDEPVAGMPVRPVEQGSVVEETQHHEAPERPSAVQETTGCTAAATGTSTV